MNIRTAEILKEVDPKARIAALVFALLDDTVLIGNCLSEIARRGKAHLFEWVTYHQYMFRPEDMYPLVDKLREIMQLHTPHIKLWQGESGAPSIGWMGGALHAYDWTELSQAKWGLRRILSDHGRDIATGLFCIADMNYAATDAIKKRNPKGILMTDEQNRVVRPKQAYRALQHLTSVFDLFQKHLHSEFIQVNHAYSCSKYLYETSDNGYQAALLWWDESAPYNFNVKVKTDVSIKHGNFSTPVVVDLLSGEVREIPQQDILKEGDTWIFQNIPVYDSPILLTDLRLIQIVK